MSRFVFFETPREALRAAVPLRADLAAIQMEWALLKLALKYCPDQPRVPAGNRDGGQWTDTAWARVAANNMPGAVVTDAAPKSRDATLGLSAPGRDKARRALVLQGGGGDFYVAPNPNANPNAPWYADPSKSLVGSYNDGILFAAEQENVDPDLIRSIMYVETTQGHYFGAGDLLDSVGLSKTILPMNIYASRWAELGTREDLSNPFTNILAGTKILKGIEANLSAPDVAIVGTLYNALDATKVSDYGARIAAVYKEKPWQ